MIGNWSMLIADSFIICCLYLSTECWWRTGNVYRTCTTQCRSTCGSYLKFTPVLRIRIRIHRIHMFLGLLDPDPDPLVRGMNPAPDPDPSILSKNSKKNLDFYCFVTSFWLFILFSDCLHNDFKVTWALKKEHPHFPLTSVYCYWAILIYVRHNDADRRILYNACYISLIP